MRTKRILLLIASTGTILLILFALNENRKEQVLGLISPAADPIPSIEITLVATPSANQIATVSGATVLESTVSSKPLSSATMSAAPKAKTKPRPTPTPTIVPTPALSQEVNGYIDRFSAQYGVDPNVMRHIAVCESGFNSSAVNYIYVGLFQFDSVTWMNIRREIGEDPNPSLRFSAKDSVQTASYAVSKGKGKLWPNCFPR